MNLRALGSAMVAALMLATAVGQANAASPKIVITDPERQFGEVRQGAVVTEKFEIRNDGDAPLQLTGIEFSAFGMNARVQQEIAPKATAALELIWDTSDYSGEAIGQARLSTNDRAEPFIILTLAGIVVPPIDIQPFPAFYLSQFAGESIERSITIRNNQDRPLALTGVRGAEERFSARIETVEPGVEYRLHVKVSPEAAIGRSRDRIQVLTDDPRRKRIGIEVNILVKPDVFASVESLDFGAVDLSLFRAAPKRAELLTEAVVIRRRDGTMRVTGIDSDLPFLTFNRTPDGPSDAFRIDVGLDLPTMTPGTFEGAVRIQTDDPDFPVISVPARIAVAD